MGRGAGRQWLRLGGHARLGAGYAGKQGLRDERLQQDASRDGHAGHDAVIVIESSSLMDSGTADSIADGIHRQLDPRWITVQRIGGAILTLFLATVSFVAVIVLWIASETLALGLLLLPVWLVLVGALAWQLQRWPAIAFRFASYRVDDAGLEIQRGVYWRTTTNVPRSRIQHTDVSQGPLERRYGLGTLVVYTAGTQHSQVNLPGLEFNVARRIRAHLLPSDHGDAV